MKLIRHTEKIPQNDAIQRYFTEKTVFFDIETTGFSPKTSFVYLIGLAIRTDRNTIEICQLLAEHREEEAELLSRFQSLLQSAETIITFNGQGFDIPFLKARASVLSLTNTWDSFQHLDLYKITAKMSNLFHLPDKKQKSLEKFLGIHREDIYTGGELIPIYYNYEKQHDSCSEHLLLCHNYEDVLGMTELLPLLTYHEFFTSPANVLEVKRQSCRPYPAVSEEEELLFCLNTPGKFQKPVFAQTKICSLMCQNSSAKLLVPVFRGKLKFFYENYRDYYYLPEEDTAIHKSVASFVDSKHRKKATKATCYTQKSGVFLPQAKTLFTPCFRAEKNSSSSYFELTDAFLSDTNALNAYASHLLPLCL